MQKNGNLTIDRICGYTYICKKILAPLVLQPALFLVRTSLHHCQHVRTMPTHGYSYEAKRLHGSGASEWYSFQSMCRHTCAGHMANYLKIVTIGPLYCDPVPVRGAYSSKRGLNQ